MNFKGHIKKIKRIDYLNYSRLNFTRLDKNEKIDDFEKILIKNFKKKINSNLLSSYPEVSSLVSLISKSYKIDLKNILLTAGIDGAIKLIIDALTNRGDRAIILEPTFAMTKIYCDIANLKIVSIKYDKNLRLDLKKLLDNIKKKTSIVILSNPNSPTGTVIEEKYIFQILNKTNKLKIPLIIDEAYIEFFGKSLIRYIKKNKNLFVLRTFSKAFGLAGLRSGFIASSKNNIDYLKKFKPMYEINSIGILLTKLILENPKIVKNYVKKCFLFKNKLFTLLKKKKIKFKDTKANFVLIEKRRIKKKIFKDCKKNKILISKKIHFEKYLRVTIGPLNKMKVFLNILNKNII